MSCTPIELLGLLSRHLPELQPYRAVLDSLGSEGHGRILAMQWQVVFQHMLIIRRQHAQFLGVNFYEAEKEAEKKVKKLKIEDPRTAWIMVVAASLDDGELFNDLRAMI